MENRYSPHRPGLVRQQSERQYGSIYESNAHARRALYKYEVSPDEDREPYNIWESMAEWLDPANARRVIETGTNDGYFHSILRNKGFSGEFIGVDIEGKDLPALEYIARMKHPDVKFVQGDAQNLQGIIETSSADKTVAGFLGYHVAKPGLMLSEAHRITEPGGTFIASSRNVSNQLDTWDWARHVALSHGFVFPQELDEHNSFISGVPTDRISVYSHFNVDQLFQSLRQSKKFEVIHEEVQDTDLWIPTDTLVGLDDIEGAIESLLPYTVNQGDGRKPTHEDMQKMGDFIRQTIRQFLIANGKTNQSKLNLKRPYYISHASQGFVVARIIK